MRTGPLSVVVLALALLVVGCGYGATVQQRGIKHQPETLRILNRQLRIYDCEGVPQGRRSCQYMRFQVAVDRPNPYEEPPPATEGSPAAAPLPDKAAAQMVQQAQQGPERAPESPGMDRICPASGKKESVKLKYEVLKYPSSEVTRHADRLESAQHLPVVAQLQQRPFISRVGFQPRWSVDSERAAASDVSAQGSAGTPLDVQICDGKRVANLDLVLLDEHIDRSATGDIYRLEVWRESDNARAHSTVETLNTVAQYALGSALTGVALVGLYIFFGATR